MKYDYLKFEEQLEVLLAQDVIYGWQAFGPGHYRINDFLDIWPRRKNYLNHQTGKHGQYSNLEDLF